MEHDERQTMRLGTYFEVNDNVKGFAGTRGRTRLFSRLLRSDGLPRLSRPLSLSSPHLDDLRQSVRELDGSRERSSGR